MYEIIIHGDLMNHLQIDVIYREDFMIRSASITNLFKELWNLLHGKDNPKLDQELSKIYFKKYKKSIKKKQYKLIAGVCSHK